MVNVVIVGQYAFVTLLPVVVMVVLTMLRMRTKLGKMPYWPWQILCGIIFGILAIVGTEMGVNTNGATINVRDAPPVAAGLFIGGPAGIIAGLIGGIERWYSVLWGRGMFTREACTIATVVAGIYAALLRRYFYEGQRPRWRQAALITTVVEVLHMLLVFVTNPEEPIRAFEVVRICTVPMVAFNATSVVLCGIVISLVEGEKVFGRDELPSTSHVVQTAMVFVMAGCFAVTSIFIAALQTSFSRAETTQMLTQVLHDVEQDVVNASDNNLLALTRRAALAIPSTDMATQEVINSLMESLSVTDIHVVDSNGIIVASSSKKYVGFDMKSGEQSRVFMDLVPGGESTYIVQSYQPMTYDPNVWRKYAGRRISDGFVQVGYDAQHFRGEIITQVQSALANRHIGQTGYLVALSEDGTIVGLQNDAGLNSREGPSLKTATEKLDENSMRKLTVGGTQYYATCLDVEGFRLIALLPCEEADLSHDVAVLINLFTQILVFAALYAVIYVVIRRVVVQGIWQVNESLEQITQGDLNEEVNVRNSKEFSMLSDGINTTVEALRDAIAAEAARIDQELEYAKSIQQSALRHVFPPYPEHDEFELYASMRPAKEVGGDFYDFYLLDENHLAFLIADVSGKGIPAAMFMMRAKTALKSLIETGADVDEVFTLANSELCEGNEADMFVTAWMGVLDLATGNLRYANAGHNPPALCRAGDSYELLQMRKNLILGCMDGIHYRINELDLGPGDVVYLYTDGVVEAINRSEEQYGNNRLIECLNRSGDCTMEELCVRVVTSVDRFAGDMLQFDDMTMLALRYNGPTTILGDGWAEL